MIGMQQYGRMEDSSMNASQTKGVERVAAAKEARERETNASGQLTAPEAAGRRETKEPCPMKMAESMGEREINVPEKETAAVRETASRWLVRP